MIFGRAIVSEMRATAAVAGPLAAANLAQMAMGFTNTVMVGSLGSGALAAAGLGASLYFTIAMVCSGVLTAVAPLAAHAIGAGDRRRAGQVAGKGLVLAALLAAPVIAMLLTVPGLLVALGYDPALAALARETAAELGDPLATGVWAAHPDPNLATPAEYRMLRRLGADWVGRGGVAEVILARHLGVRVVGLVGLPGSESRLAALVRALVARLP